MIPQEQIVSDLGRSPGCTLRLFLSKIRPRSKEYHPLGRKKKEEEASVGKTINCPSCSLRHRTSHLPGCGPHCTTVNWCWMILLLQPLQGRWFHLSNFTAVISNSNEKCQNWQKLLILEGPKTKKLVMEIRSYVASQQSKRYGR